MKTTTDGVAVVDVAVVGGGLGGLTAAAIVARRGLRAVVLERASAPGGRAATREKGGFFFNEGAHALYAGGAAARVLATLGVRPRGRRPPAGGIALHQGRPHALPSTLGALLTTGLVPFGGKLAGASLFARLGSIDTAKLANVSWSDFVAARVTHPVMREALGAFVRVSTYVDAPEVASAGAIVDQLRLAQQPGVLYVDGGWQTLVNAVADTGRAAGVDTWTGARVLAAVPEGGAWRVALEDGRALRARAVVLATGPSSARSIVASDAIASWASAAVPARAACLDVALRRLPNERATFALGVDRPLYLSVHSRTARVAPDGAALVSTMKYLAPGGPSDAASDEAELEGMLDTLQPGWRDHVVERRWLPSMVATNAVVTAAGGGTRGRAATRVPDAPGAFVVGDWVGSEGMLLDASLASAERAAEAVSEHLSMAKVA